MKNEYNMIKYLESLLIAGHMILNTVDCTRPNGGKLPRNVDLMMSDFAGGASGFPMTFYGGKYSGEIYHTHTSMHSTV